MSRTAIRDVFAGGELICSNGRHKLQDEIVSLYRSVYQKVWQA